MASPLAMALSMQNAVNPSQSPIQPADVLGAYKLSSQVAEQNYQAKLQQMQALWGGLASLGAAGILGFGPSLAKKYFGTQAANAATPASTAAAPASAAPAAGSADAGAAAATGDSAAVAPDLANATAAMDSAALPSEFSIGSVAPSVAPSIAADYGLTGAGSGLGALGADVTGAAGSIAADMGAGAAGDAAAAATPDFLASFLPFLAM